MSQANPLEALKALWKADRSAWTASVNVPECVGFFLDCSTRPKWTCGQLSECLSVSTWGELKMAHRDGDSVLFSNLTSKERANVVGTVLDRMVKSGHLTVTMLNAVRHYSWKVS